MENSSQSEALLKLGKKIVDEFGLDQSVDTLGRWMAHYIAELIHDVETADAKGKPAKSARCSAAILDLWRHRNNFRNDKRPFEDFEPVLRTLESLDPTDHTPRYFRNIFNQAETDTDTKTSKWLKAADSLDYSAKILIGYCLAQAGKTALDKSKPWVELAEAAGADDGGDFITIRFVKTENDLLERPEELKDTARKLMQDRINRLGKFEAIASHLRVFLQDRLKEFKNQPSSQPRRGKSKRRKQSKRPTKGPAKKR
jgi:hypothetical protein